MDVLKESCMIKRASDFVNTTYHVKLLHCETLNWNTMQFEVLGNISFVQHQSSSLLLYKFQQLALYIPIFVYHIHSFVKTVFPVGANVLIRQDTRFISCNTLMQVNEQLEKYLWRLLFIVMRHSKSQAMSINLYLSFQLVTHTPATSTQSLNIRELQDLLLQIWYIIP